MSVTDENGCERAEAAEARAARLAAALREYGEDDGFGRWHEFGCVEDFTDFKTGEPLSRCSRARAALADSQKDEDAHARVNNS